MAAGKKAEFIAQNLQLLQHRPDVEADRLTSYRRASMSAQRH
jgi:hypothetical protein